MKTYKWIEKNIPLDHLETLSSKVAESLRGDEFFCLWLIGDIGAGKTTLTGSILHNLGLSKSQPVTSPTFTYLSDYKLKNKIYAHLDFYRLEKSKESISDLLSYMDYDGLFIEWPENISDTEIIRPTHKLYIEKNEDLKTRNYFFSEV